MKRLSILGVLSILLFNWIGSHLYTTLVEQYTNRASTVEIEPAIPEKIPGFHFMLHVKDIDSDDFLEFTSGSDHSDNPMIINDSGNFFADRTSSENKHVSYRFFNGEYYDKAHNPLENFPASGLSSKFSDRYIFRIPASFLSPHAHPPQHIG